MHLMPLGYASAVVITVIMPHESTCLDSGNITMLAVVAHEGGVGHVVGLHPGSPHVSHHLMGCCHVPGSTVCIQQSGVAHHPRRNAAACHLPDHFSSSALHSRSLHKFVVSTMFCRTLTGAKCMRSVTFDALCFMSSEKRITCPQMQWQTFLRLTQYDWRHAHHSKAEAAVRTDEGAFAS